MTKFGKGIAGALIAATSVLAFLPPAASSTFVAWRVSGVAANDLLNVRAYPSSGSKVLVGYSNGTTLSMTGKCTGGIRLDEIQNQPISKQRQMIRTKWCEAWLDPKGNGKFRTGWVYGRYIRPA